MWRILLCGVLFSLTRAASTDDEDFIPLRLTSTRIPNAGRLELYIGRRWGTIHAGNNDNIAKVACRELGYRGYSVAMPPGIRGDRHKPVWFDNVQCNGEEVSVFNCSKRRYRDRYSYHTKDVAVFCLNTTREQVPFRLANGLSGNSGRLEMKINEDWLTVCNKDFNHNAVQVACRNMGYTGVSRLVSAMEQKQNAHSIKLGSLNCDGKERYLLECVGVVESLFDDCGNEESSIICTNQTTETVPLRLVDGMTSNSGLLEVQIDDRWAKICRNNFDAKAVKVACHSLGYSGFSAQIKIPENELFNRTWWIYGWKCEGTESHLLDCPYHVLPRQYCGHGLGVSIVCTNYTTGDFPVTLTDLVTSDSGRLTISIGGVWGTVCSKGFDIQDANVVCKDIGYSGADGIDGAMKQYTQLLNAPVWISNLDCKGTESLLSNCSYNQEGTDKCYHHDDVSVRCRRDSKDKFRLRLRGATPDSGRLEIKVGRQYGTVCKANFGHTEGNVACRTMGYWTLHRFIELPSTARPSSIPVWLDNVKCDGSESHLIECSHNGLGVHNCSHNDDIAIKCLQKDAVSARLRHGMRFNMGRLEIEIDGVWGTVCNEDFNYRDATVACRMLGYQGAYAIMGGMDKVKSDVVLSIWLHGLNCSGSESHLLDCPHRGIGVHSCTHGQDVGLKCLTREPVSARLMDGLVAKSGRLELKIDRVWGAVCKTGFDQRDAAVACRMLGYAGLPLALGTHSRPRADRSPMWMYDVRCHGNESSLLDCPHEIAGGDGWDFEQSCLGEISIGCFSSETVQTVSARLVDGTHPNKGIVEIQIDGVWGNICMPRFGITFNLATVVCRMVGISGRSYYSNTPPLNTRSTRSPVWLGGPQCRGNETSVLECENTTGQKTCDHTNDMYVRCLGP